MGLQPCQRHRICLALSYGHLQPRITTEPVYPPAATTGKDLQLRGRAAHSHARASESSRCLNPDRCWRVTRGSFTLTLTAALGHTRGGTGAAGAARGKQALPVRGRPICGTAELCTVREICMGVRGGMYCGASACAGRGRRMLRRGLPVSVAAHDGSAATGPRTA